ncbi:hypothetical protein CEK26_004483 [Fusarium fujikuroi]|uniref:Uncharacterized protein n=1 Tax=Fusarium fujikuroi TaxID=5127 RepID=A0A5Q3FJB5_FUSFU|nr:hypothetical protein CEK27_004481 [Fusarium fujikuroi]QGI77706.1 hypothetical protein CEK25_004435 [Fusarium fujikuroi]QGI91414.1 hypothetical protein CEK26_004483 [Fusarium fujikuroi]VTT59767.1 unnamed protein product [Fusarium fujikuroi]VTT62638.1 unnamed protein product [Fusarium fujikuroi]
MRAAGQFGTNRGPITVKVTRKADSHELDQSDMIWNVFMGLNRVGFSSCRCLSPENYHVSTFRFGYVFAPIDRLNLSCSMSYMPDFATSIFIPVSHFVTARLHDAARKLHFNFRHDYNTFPSTPFGRSPITGTFITIRSALLYVRSADQSCDPCYRHSPYCQLEMNNWGRKNNPDDLRH